jgi:hypothetical protein
MTVITSPPARRFRADRHDVRLAVGVALVVIAVVAGSALLGSAGDRVPVWSLRSALAAGTTLRADDLVPAPVAGDSVALYAGSSTDVTGKVLTRDLGAGELLPLSALGAPGGAARRLVTVAVDPLHAPPGLARGERVDVYVTPRDGASVGGSGTVRVLPTLVLARALVADPGASDPAGASTQIGVVLDVAAADADRAVAAARGGDVDLVRVGTGV